MSAAEALTRGFNLQHMGAQIRLWTLHPAGTCTGSDQAQCEAAGRTAPPPQDKKGQGGRMWRSHQNQHCQGPCIKWGKWSKNEMMTNKCFGSITLFCVLDTKYILKKYILKKLTELPSPTTLPRKWPPGEFPGYSIQLLWPRSRAGFCGHWGHRFTKAPSLI